MVYCSFVLQPPTYCIDFSVLKEKYDPRRDKGPSRIRTYCKAIESYTKARIQVDIPQWLDRDRRDVRFGIQGKNDAVRKAIEHIQGEFIFRKVGYTCVNIHGCRVNHVPSYCKDDIS